MLWGFRKVGAEMKYLMTVGDIDSSEIWFILAFNSVLDRVNADEVMREHRRDYEDCYDTDNMLEALENSGIEYEIFNDIYGLWI